MAWQAGTEWRAALHGEFPLPGDEVLPGQGQDPLEQGLKVRGRERFPKLHQHPGPAAQADVQPGDVRQGPLAVDPAVFRPDAGQAQALDLVGHQGL